MDLDMSDAFDSENMDSFSVVRQKETLVLGRPTITPTTLPKVWGVITAASPNNVSRLPEGTRFTHGISVVTRTKLQGAVAGHQPDLINWRGSQYLVITAEPYAHVGSGFWQILAESVTSQETN